MKGNMELRWLPHDAHHPINDLGRAFAPIIPRAVRLANGGGPIQHPKFA
jgi:hypothetical protein